MSSWSTRACAAGAAGRAGVMRIAASTSPGVTGRALLEPGVERAQHLLGRAARSGAAAVQRQVVAAAADVHAEPLSICTRLRSSSPQRSISRRLSGNCRTLSDGSSGFGAGYGAVIANGPPAQILD